jgi:hypothetical protein
MAKKPDPSLGLRAMMHSEDIPEITKEPLIISLIAKHETFPHESTELYRKYQGDRLLGSLGKVPSFPKT